MNEAKIGASLLHHGYFKLPPHEAFWKSIKITSSQHDAAINLYHNPL
jgi:hypothetical protein